MCLPAFLQITSKSRRHAKHAARNRPCEVLACLTHSSATQYSMLRRAAAFAVTCDILGYPDLNHDVALNFCRIWHGTLFRLHHFRYSPYALSICNFNPLPPRQTHSPAKSRMADGIATCNTPKSKVCMQSKKHRRIENPTTKMSGHTTAKVVARSIHSALV